MTCRFFSTSLFAICLLLGSNTVWSMPQPAVICEATVTTASKFSEVKPIGDFAELDFPFSIDQVPDKARYRQLIEDLKMPSLDQSRNFVFEIEGRTNMLNYVAAVARAIGSEEETALEEIHFEHVTSMLAPLIPFKVWAKQLFGRELKGKEEKWASGWLGLFWVPAGIIWDIFKNPVVSADRYLYLKIQDDNEYFRELKSAASQFLRMDPEPVHIHRDIKATAYHWQNISNQPAPIIEVNSAVQTRLNTMPVVSGVINNIIGLFHKSDEKPELEIKTDILFSAEKEKLMLIVRTKEAK